MSKMLKLLNKAKKSEDDQWGIEENQHQASHQNTNNLLAVVGNEVDAHYKDAVNHEDMDDHIDRDAISFKARLAVPILAIALTMAVFSLFLSYKALARVKDNQFHAMNLKKHEQKFTIIENVLTEIQEREVMELSKLKAELKLVLSDIKLQKDEIEEMVIDHNTLKVVVDDLRVTDRLLLDKYISLNQGVKDIGHQITQKIQEGRNL